MKNLTDYELENMRGEATKENVEDLVNFILEQKKEIKTAAEIIDGYHNFIVTPPHVQPMADRWLKAYRIKSQS
jgi:hypothetical protein